MKESPKPLISHIPSFLNYCKIEKGLSDNTRENYKRFLNKFILWLKKTNKGDLKPHQLTADDIWKYRLFLSRNIDPKTGKILKKITQNYYLIALRALLSYFSARDVVLLPADRIKLSKVIKESKKETYLTLEQIEEILFLPNIKTGSGLRDRVILEILISTGLKVRQLINLNRNQIKMDKEVLPWINKYLKSREDKNEALFVNYKARKDADKRLTVRSVERIVNEYGRLLNLPFSLTPEILRWARAIALLNKEKKPEIIKKPYTHLSSLVKNYKYQNSENKISEDNLEKNSSSWHLIEAIINKEIIWLKDIIPVLPGSYKANPPLLNCDDCILRKIAILIVGGKVKATEYKSGNGQDLWNNLTKKIKISKTSWHGKEWHRKMMDVIYEYFKLRDCKVILEPALNHGRADLRIYPNQEETIYIEVGTTSLYKLWFNLLSMKNVTFLIIPSEEKVIEFKV